MSTTQTQPVQISPVVTQESRPVPDPTALTTSFVLRQIAALTDKVETRLDGMDKAIDLLQKHNDKQPTTEAVDLQVKALEKLADEKFSGVKRQFEDGKVAIDAAFQASKEAVGKTETSFAKQIESMNEKIDDLKDRLTSGEGHAKGLGDGWGIIVGAGGLLIALITLGVMVATKLH